jgi:TonB family protein
MARTHTRPPLPPGFDPATTSGKTLLNLVVDVNGVVADASVASSSGNTVLDQAALDHARKTWLWRPTDPSCMPISTKVLIDWSPPKPPGPPPPIYTVPRRY